MFKFLITPYLIEVFYVIGVIFPFYFLYIFRIKIKSFLKCNFNYKKEFIFAIILFIIMYEIALRVFCEFIIVYFNMFEELKRIT